MIRDGGVVRAQSPLLGDLVMTRVGDNVEVGRASNGGSYLPQLSFPSARASVTYRSCYVVTTDLSKCRQDVIAGTRGKKRTPAESPRDPRIRYRVSAHGRRVLVEVRMRKAARGTTSLALLRGRRSIHMHRVASSHRWRRYRAKATSAGRWRVRFRFVGRTGWQTRRGILRVRVR